MVKYLTLAAVIGFGASAASAQDAGAPPPPPAPLTTDAPSWTGPYVGIQGGYGFDAGQKIGVSGQTATQQAAIGNGTRPGQLNQDRAGAFGGGQIGYNLQRGHLLVGAEGDFQYIFKRHGSDAYGVDRRLTYTKSDLDWMGTGRGRIGYVLNDNSGVLYGTGGYAFGRVKGYSNFYGTDGSLAYTGGHKYTADGWTAGIGAEFRPFAHREGPMSRVSFKLESNYYDLGSSHIQAQGVNGRTGGYTLALDTKGYNTRFGINYAF